MSAGDDVAELRRAAVALAQAAQDLRESGGMRNSATITQNPGGSLALACAVLVGMNVMLAAVLVLIGLRTFDLDDKLSAIYMLAPHLNPQQQEQEK